MHILPVVLTLLTLGVVPYAAAASLVPAHTKAQAEQNVLRVVAKSWKPSRIPGLVDPQTHLLANNTEAICDGRGKPHGGRRYKRFVCVVRPGVHRPGAGLYVSYRALPHGRFRVHWLAFKR